MLHDRHQLHFIKRLPGRPDALDGDGLGLFAFEVCDADVDWQIDFLESHFELIEQVECKAFFLGDDIVEEVGVNFDAQGFESRDQARKIVETGIKGTPDSTIFLA